MAEAKTVADKLVAGSRGARRRMKGAAKRAVRRIRTSPASSTASAAEPLASTPIGMVEAFEYRQILGWVMAAAADFPIRVSLHINDMEVAATWADHPSSRNTWSEVRGFRIGLADVWKYCQRSDRVTVQVDGRPLPIAAKGIYKRPGTDGEFSLKDLQRKFDEDFVFGQTGRLQLSKRHDIKWQQSVLGLYRQVSEVVAREYGYEPFVVYGTLLGLVREGGFIGHDVDFDAAYVSKLTDGRAAGAELRDIAFTLVDAGFDVTCRTTALHIHDHADHAVRIDLFHTYFDEDDRLAFPFGVAGKTKITKADWAGLVDAELGGDTVKLPANSEAMAEHLYGSSWRTPIAGFNWYRARTGWAKEGHLPAEYTEEVYWANFYARNELTTGSSFSEFVGARGDIPNTVLDIGCGDGRDSFAFARSGRRARGLDRSHIGVRHAAAKADKAGLGDVLSFVAGDVGDASAVHEIVKQTREAADGGPLLFYMRFFLHSITADTQETLMTALAQAAQDGDMLAAEFRTEKDEANKKTYGKHYRRYQDGFAYGQSLRDRYGFDVLHEEEGTGLAPYKDEDPVLYRVVAKKQ